MAGCPLAWMAQTLRGDTVPGGYPHAQHQIMVPMEVNPNGTWIRRMSGRRDYQTYLGLARAPNPVSKDMFAKKSSRLGVCDVWPA